MAWDADILLENANKFSDLIETLKSDAALYEHVPHNAHLAVELAAKSFLARHGQPERDSHDFSVLFQLTFAQYPKGLLGALQANENEDVYTAYKAIKSVWNMNKRYEKWKFKHNTVHNHCIAYKKVFKWINTL